MSVRLRLTRVGSKKNPIWRLVATDQRSPRDGRFIETLGHYNPQTEPSTIVIDQERVEHWLARGAQPTETVRKLIRAHAAGGGAPSADAGAAASSEGAVAVAEAPAAEEAAADAPAADAPAAEEGAADAEQPADATADAEPEAPAEPAAEAEQAEGGDADADAGESS